MTGENEDWTGMVTKALNECFSLICERYPELVARPRVYTTARTGDPGVQIGSLEIEVATPEGLEWTRRVLESNARLEQIRAKMVEVELSPDDRALFDRAATLLKDQPCCGAGLIMVGGQGGKWRVKPRGQEYTLGVGDTHKSAILNAMEAALGSDDDEEDSDDDHTG